VPGPHALLGELTDAELLARTASGDRDAFGVLVERHRARVFRLARAVTASHEEAEDVLQQAFLSAWQSASAFRGDASIVTWLLTIARNAAWQGRARQARSPIDDTPIDELGIRAGGGGAPPAPRAVRARAPPRLDAALGSLAPEDRQVLTLRDIDGLSGEEAAAVMGLALPALKSRLHRARLRLAGAIRKDVSRAAR
jgi:RNA polymerase sigma-70 factor (ECF subfamily)